MEKEPFESIFSSGRSQMMKLLLPCLPADKRGIFAIWIRLQELLYTMQFVKLHGPEISMPPPPEGEALLDSMLPYLDIEQKNQLNMLKQAMHQMEQIKEAMEMAGMLQELFPEGMDATQMDPSEMLRFFSELSPAQKDQKEKNDDGSLDDG